MVASLPLHDLHNPALGLVAGVGRQPALLLLWKVTSPSNSGAVRCHHCVLFFPVAVALGGSVAVGEAARPMNSPSSVTPPVELIQPSAPGEMSRTHSSMAALIWAVFA